MGKYNIIDKYERNAYNELKEYTFEEVKAYFEPPVELTELHEAWAAVSDVEELREYLEVQAEGMEVHYEIIETE